MNDFKAIGFDWGGVILQYPDGSFMHGVSALVGVDPSAFRKAYFTHNHMVNKGTSDADYTNADEMWDAILNDLGKEDQLERVMEFIQARPSGVVDARMIELIQELKEAGWKLGCLTNNSTTGAQHIRDGKYDTLFETFLVSTEIGHMKPEHEAFRLLANGLGILMEELIFIDDSQRSLSSSNELGYTPILFESPTQLRSELSRLGIL